MKAILYAAKSTADEKGSIPTQLDDGRALAERDGLEVVGQYSDESASAWSGDRGPQLKAAKEHAERLAADEGECALIVQHSDRLARGDGKQAAHLVEYALWAIKSDVKIRSIQDPQTFSDLLYAVVTGQRNTEDSRRKSQSVRDGMKRRAARGLYTGRRPYGYANDPERGLVIVPGEAEIVRRIFAEFLAGRSMVAIARGLHEDGVPTMTGATWRQAQISGILRRAVYAGKLGYDGELHDGQHEAILDAETWQRASDLLAVRGPSQGRGRPPKGHHLFRDGMLRCGSCGDAMVPRTKTKPYWQEYYCCTGHIQLGDSYCTQGCVKRSDVDEAVFDRFTKVGLDIEATREALREAHDRRLAEVRTALRDAEREAHQARERLARVRRDYTDGKLDADDWREFKEDLTAEQDAAVAVVARLRDQEADVDGWSELKDAEAETLHHLADIRRAVIGEIRAAEGLDAVRAALRRLFESFTIYPDEARIDPKRRTTGLLNYDLTDPAHPTGELVGLTPSRVPLDLAVNKSDEGSGSL